MMKRIRRFVSIWWPVSLAIVAIVFSRDGQTLATGGGWCEPAQLWHGK